MKKVTLNKIGVGSFAKVIGITYAAIAFVAGVISSLSVASNEITSSTPFVASLGISLSILGLAAVIFPLVAFVIGWIHGAVVALVLNFVFKESKGLEIEITEEK